MQHPVRVRSARWSGLRQSLVFGVLVLIALCAAPAQDTTQAPQPNPPASPAAPSDQSRPASVTLKTTIHHVVLQVIAKDKQDRPVRDLTEKDFEISEKVGWTGKSREKIASFRLVDKTAPRQSPPPQDLVRIPAGSYSNLMAVREPEAPLTVLLLDALNTDWAAPDIRQEIRKTVDSVKFDVPVSVMLLNNNLQMLQDFNSDAKLLHTTVNKFLKAGPFLYRQPTVQGPSAASLTHMDQQLAALKQLGPIPGPSTAMQQQLGVAFNPAALPAAVDAERVTNDRVQMTVDALRAIARHLAGYPGRKKLVWISSSFPFSVMMDPSDETNTGQSYLDEIAQATNALSNAQVAVYPIRPGGVWMPDVYDITQKDRPTSPMGKQFGMGMEMSRQSYAYNAANSTMEQVGDQTGGVFCTGGNDQSDCLKKALTDGYTYYELGYYPPSDTWKEGFHRITVTTNRRGVRLFFRRGYYADADEPGPAQKRKTDAELKQAACTDLLTATGLPLTVTPLPSSSADVARYSLKVEGLASLNATNLAGAALHLQLTFAACTFDDHGKPLQFGQFPVEQDVHESEITNLKEHGFQRITNFNPNPHASRIRWLVQDTQSGTLGSVDLPYQPITSTSPTNTQLASVEQQDISVALPTAVAPAAFVPATPNTPTLPSTLSASTLYPKLQTDAQIATYCDGLGQPGAHPDALSKVCQYSLSLRTKLPNLLCERKTSRHWRANNYHARDEIVTEVAYQAGVEYDKDVVAGSKSGNSSVFRKNSSTNSSTSGGELSEMLSAIFQPATDADFDFSGEEVLNTVPAFVFQYNVDQKNNQFYFLRAIFQNGGEAAFHPGYRGRFWVEKSSFRLLRVERETTDIASGFPISYVSTIVNYDDVALGDGTRFVLPVDADLVTCAPNEGKECAHNLVHYGKYRKFRATTKIVFSQDSSR